jgi:hypothetical protein
MISSRINVLIASAFSLVCSATQGETIQGYVVDAGGHRVRGARVQAWEMVRTDQRPLQQPRRLAETTTNDHGDFVIAVDARQANMLIASYDHHSGATKPSFTSPVRITLHESAEGIFLYAPRPDRTALKQHHVIEAREFLPCTLTPALVLSPRSTFRSPRVPPFWIRSAPRHFESGEVYQAPLPPKFASRSSTRETTQRVNAQTI